MGMPRLEKDYQTYNPNARNFNGWTPLHFAVKRIKDILERDFQNVKALDEPECSLPLSPLPAVYFIVFRHEVVSAHAVQCGGLGFPSNPFFQ